jgi:hypothetical protein
MGKGSLLAHVYAIYEVLLACITPCGQIGRQCSVVCLACQ